MKKKLPAWLMVLITCAAAWLIIWLAAIGIDALSSYMFTVWGVASASDILLAPAWIRIIADNYGSIVSFVQSLALIALALPLAQAFRSPKATWGRGMFMGLALGVLAAAGALAALFITGSVRLNAFNRGNALPAVFSFIVLAAREMGFSLIFAWLIPSFLPESKYRFDIWISAAIYALFALSDAPAQIINRALTAAICAFMYKGLGLGAAYLFRLGYNTVLYAIMGAYGDLGGFFETYPAAHDWLSGEYAGPMAGYMATVFLAAVLFISIHAVTGGNDGRTDANKRD